MIHGCHIQRSGFIGTPMAVGKLSLPHEQWYLFKTSKLSPLIKIDYFEIEYLKT